jgi:hypothetical protein
MPEANEMRIDVTYFGPLVEGGRIGAMDLGPSIFGLGKMVSQASLVLYGDSTRVNVEVEADFERGSFGLEAFIVSAAEGVWEALASDDLTNVLTNLGLGVGGTVGLFKVFRWIRGRKVERAEKTPTGVTLTIHDESLHLTFVEYKLLVNPEMIEALESFVLPLKREGIDGVQIRPERGEPETITRHEASYFTRRVLPEEEISVDSSTAIVEVVSPSFREGNKWRLAQGSTTFWAEVLDEDFLQRVYRHEITFGKGDALHVEMETTTTRTAGELQYDRIVIRVLKVIEADRGTQGTLDLS